ncbi:M23 family metallopeptidase [Prolixibacteraceae bacterium Z1-6]|uniref:M23 family metallopeptidase n=1 Tax=Draconibacterium aestuarii TaxID=2998507 RepID=A0A9X3J751_9BACT|nr:M23 family metallopeptidase [Prolixibacteraceae bacterium Z1-6]
MDKRKKLYEKLKNQYRLIVYNDTTFQSVWSMKLSMLKVFTVTSLASAVIVVLVILLIATTGLREYIPGYPKAEYRQMLVHNALKVDSLEHELAARDRFFRGIQSIMSGEIPEDSLSIQEETPQEQVQFVEYNHDSVFQDKLLAEQLSLSIQNNENKATELSQIHFFVPLKGVITEHFNSSPNHFGIDLVSVPNARISAVLGGTVIFSGWTLETGYVIYLQHEADLISVYKHNAELLKNTGDKVNAGEAIAIIGNTGELTSGPHLHFELWHKGSALNPEQYIDF